MTSVAPPPPPPPPQGAGSAVQLTVTANGSAALQLSKMALDSLVSGLVKTSTAGGETTLQTPQGPLSFKAPFALPANAQATFKLIQTQPSVQMQLVSVNGKPIAPNTPAAKVFQLASPTGPTQGASPHPQSNMVNSTGQLAQPTTQTLNAPATTLSFNSATGIKALVLNVTQNVNTPASAQTNTTLKAGVTQGTSSPASSRGTQTQTLSPQGGQTVQQTGQPSSSATPLQAGNTLNVRLLSVQLPGQPLQETSPPTAQTTTSSTTLQGQVQGRNVNGQPVIKLPQGQLLLQTNANIPNDTVVKLEVLSVEQTKARPAIQTESAKPVNFTGVAGNWDTLEEALSTLKDANPLLADKLSQTILPKPDQRLAANMIFFLKALGRGQIKNWMDDQTLRAIARTKPDMISRLEGDFETLSTKAKTPNATDWKIAYVPIQDQQQLSQIRIAHRQPEEETPDGQEEPGVRFVIDLDLSHLGPLQLDGLAKEKQKKFDLIFRTQRPLPGFMRQEIHTLFENGMRSITFDGKLLFQVTPNFVEIEGIDVTQKDINLGMLV